MRVLAKVFNHFVKKIPNKSWIRAIIEFRAIYKHERYAKVAEALNEAQCSSVLDVGSGEISFLKQMGFSSHIS